VSTKRKQTPRRVNQRNPKGTGGIYEKNGKWVAFVPVAEGDWWNLRKERQVGGLRSGRTHQVW